MPKSRQRWVTKASISSKVSAVEEELHALTRGQLARVALALQPLFPTAQRGAALKVV